MCVACCFCGVVYVRLVVFDVFKLSEHEWGHMITMTHGYKRFEIVSASFVDIIHNKCLVKPWFLWPDNKFNKNLQITRVPSRKGSG